MPNPIAPALTAVELNRVAHRNSVFIYSDGTGKLYSSADGVTWTICTSRFGETKIFEAREAKP